MDKKQKILDVLTSNYNVNLFSENGRLHIAQKILDALEKVGLQKFINQSPNGVSTNLSSDKLKYNLGFRKRLALARATLSSGNLILMDEPTEGLDKAGAEIFYDYLNECIGAQKTVIVLSHDPAIIKGAGTLINLDNYQVVSETLNLLSSKQES